MTLDLEQFNEIKSKSNFKMKTTCALYFQYCHSLHLDLFYYL